MIDTKIQKIKEFIDFNYCSLSSIAGKTPKKREWNPEKKEEEKNCEGACRGNE